MSKIKLGLDLGTNSIGWAVLEKTEGKYDFLEFRNEDEKLIPTKGSYIFPKGADANENSKAAERRGFRGTRRRLSRIILRKIVTLKVLDEYDLCPPFKQGELNKWKNKRIYPCNNETFIEWQRTGKKNGNSKIEKLKQPYYLRHLAATERDLMDTKQGRLQLGRAFYHLAQRRGYLSNSEEEQTEDHLEKFKIDITNLMEVTSGTGDFWEPFNVILDPLKKKDNKVKKLGNKIIKELGKESSFEKIKEFIQQEFDKPENLGKVMKAIGELTKKIDKAAEIGECAPTMGSYFYSIYAKEDKKTGLITKIRGRYTHREEHYLKEFDRICCVQNLDGIDENYSIEEPAKRYSGLVLKLYNAIFYQRPLKSQKGLVAKCPFEPKRKRIAISHPLFEEFRMWESINRIKIGRSQNAKLDFLNADEKDTIKLLFLQKTDFEFSKIAKKLSGDNTYCYIKYPDKVYFKGEIIEGGVAEVFFNFPVDKKFSACPTISDLKRILGEDTYNSIPLLNTGYKEEKGKKQVSIEDIWHCLFSDEIGKKDKKEVRRVFAKKHLNLNEEGIEGFSKIKLTKGYGSLSKAALKKIIPFLEKGEIYSHAVFLANVSEVLGRQLSNEEQEKVNTTITSALKAHQKEKQTNGIINNYINHIKEHKESLGNNVLSIEEHRKDLNQEIVNWLGESRYIALSVSEQTKIQEDCWNRFSRVAMDQLPKDISYLSTLTIPEFISEKLTQSFPSDKIDVYKLYHPSAMESYEPVDKKLENPEISSIKNPVFNRAMHQIKRLCNELIRKGVVDKDTEVNIEVAGEINSASYRRALTQWQKEQETIRDWAKKEIIKTYPKECRDEINPSDNDVIKYLFWKEQNHKCLYTGKEIPICEFLGGKTTFDIEHTIPRSKFHDNSLINKTLADAEFNRKIKQETLPALLKKSYKGVQINGDSIISNRDSNLRAYSLKGTTPHWNVDLDTLKREYRKFKTAAKATSDPVSHDEIMTKAHYTKLKLDYLSNKHKTFEIEEVTNQFTNTNLVDTRIIAKYARAYLKSYFKKVNAVNGKITDTLRKMWGLEGEYEQKDRSNHIHHCIDAVTVACIERGIVNRISEAFHKYESDYFKGNDNPKYRVKAPMDNFIERMHNLHKEVFVYHRKIDRIKPLLESLEKGNTSKQNLRGKLNSQNPYAHIERNGELIFAKREPISKISGKDIENIVDEGVKKRLLDLAATKGWEKLMEFQVKEDENAAEKELEHKKTTAFKVYEKLKKAKANKTLIKSDLAETQLGTDFHDIVSLINEIYQAIQENDLEENKKIRLKEKVEKEVNDIVRSKGLDILLKDSEAIILPEYYDEEKGKQIGKMVIKKIRLKSSVSNLKDYKYKEYREIDRSKFEYKQDYYFDKESYTNYEARIYGDLIPDENGKISKRDYVLINHYNIVKNVFEIENGTPILKLHQDDMFLVFDKSPTDEIIWEDKMDIQNRLFKVVKFNENGVIVLARHNYASGNVDSAKAVGTESNLANITEVVLRRSPSTLKVIPAKIDTLGKIDIEYSKEYIERYS